MRRDEVGPPIAYDRLKRLIDAVAAAILLVLTAPLQLVVAVAIRRKLGGPVLFRQQRPGRHGEPFTLVKFRTMQPLDPVNGLTSDADRLTPLGAKLRRSSLDELPTLLNVLRGDMSLVGPRPLLMQYLPLYSEFEAHRHDVRPGVTGLAQVTGRNTLSWPDKFAADIRYVERRSLRLDAWILSRTIASVLRREGISAAGEVTMPEFQGSSTPTSAS